MIHNGNLWLLTMTQERYEHISLMIKNIYPLFDGIIAIVNQPSNDGTYELLEQNKKRGKIIKRSFVPNHGFLMNELLFCNHIKDNDYCVYLDSPESMTDEFIKIISVLINDFEKNNIGALYWDQRPYLFKYNQYMQFFGAYHWGLDNIEGQIIVLPDKDKYIINKRKDNPCISWCLNPIKSYICYPLSNETTIMYSKYGQSIVEKEEKKRREIRKYLQYNLDLDLNTLNDLINYFEKIYKKEIIPDEYLTKVIEEQYRLSELFQLKILRMDFMKDIVPKRYKFSFSDYLKYENGFINPNYESTIIKYDKGIFN